MPTIVVIFVWNEHADAFGVQQFMHIYRRGQWVSFFPGRHVLILEVMHWSFLYLYVYFDTFCCGVDLIVLFLHDFQCSMENITSGIHATQMICKAI